MKMSKPILFSSFILANLLIAQTDVFAKMGEHQGHHGEFAAGKSPEKDSTFDKKAPEKEFTADKGFAAEGK